MEKRKKSIKKKIKPFFNNHFEWIALSVGLLVMALMNPYTQNGAGWCIYERLGISFCPGDGLGHSIAFLFRGDFFRAWHANVMGPFAVVIIFSRVAYLFKQNVWTKSSNDNQNK